MRRRTFAAASFAAGLLGSSRLSHGKEVRIVYVYAGAGGASDTVARAMREVLERNSPLDMQLIVENRPVGTESGKLFQKVRSGSLHVITGDSLRRLQLYTPYQFKDYFRPLMSLGRDVSLLMCSPRLGAKTVDDLRRLSGTVRVASPRSIFAGGVPMKQLAAPMVAGQVLRNAHVKYVDVAASSFRLALENENVDLTIYSLDQVPRLPGASALMASQSFPDAGLGWSITQLARYVEPLPVEDEFLVCCDKGWSPADIQRVSTALTSDYYSIRSILRSRLPGIQPSSLNAAQAQTHLQAYFHGIPMAVFSSQIYLECGKAFPCETSPLDQRVAAMMTANRDGIKSAPDCPAPGLANQGTGAPPGPVDPKFPPCLDPRIAMGSKNPLPEEPKTSEKPLTLADKIKLDNERLEHLKKPTEEDWDAIRETEKKLFGPEEQPAPQTKPNEQTNQNKSVTKPKTP
jgi:hypothetical protein